MVNAEITAEQAQLNSAMRFYSKMWPEQITDIQNKVYEYLTGKGRAADSIPLFTPGVADRNFVRAVIMAQSEMKLSKVDGKWGDTTNSVFIMYQREQAIPFKTSVKVGPIKTYRDKDKELVGRVEIGKIKVIRGPAAIELYAREYAVGDRTFRMVSRDEGRLNRSNSSNDIERTALASGTRIQELSQGRWVPSDISVLHRAMASAEETKPKGVARVVSE
jgi:hypothetical protein